MNYDAIATDALRLWSRNSTQMVRDLFHAEPDAWQKEALDAWDSNDQPRVRLSLQACAGPGKSTALSWMGWNGMLCHSLPDGHPNGAAVSISGDNLRNGLWKELAVWRDRSDVLKAAFEMTTKRIFERNHPKTWYLDARTFPRTADAEAQGRTLSGLHSPAIFYLIDEAGDMPPSVGRAADQGLSNCRWGRIAMAGNPTSHAGLLYHAAVDQADRYIVIRITGDPDDPRRSPRVDLAEARASIALYGRDNPWVMAYILGRFPPSALNTLLGPDDVRAAMARHLREDQYSFSQKRLGVDVARFGDDRTVIFPRQGLAAFRPVVMRNARTEAIAGRVAAAIGKWGSELQLIDSTGGWGAGTVDALRLAGHPVIEVNFSDPADDHRYFNKRSEMYFRAAEWVKNGGALPNVPELVREATAATYWFDAGKLRVVEKAQIKTLLAGQSPDLWDAFITTFAIVDLPASVEALTGGIVSSGRASVKADWDPFAEDR